MRKDADTTTDIAEPLARRWSNRAFADQDVTEADLEALLEAARWSPSCFNEQPWRLLITRRGTDAHAKLAACLSEGNRWAHAAPVLILTVAKATFTRNDKPNRHAWHDVGLAMMSLSVEATRRGLGLHQMAGFDAAQAREAFSIPEGFDPVTAVALGHPGAPESLPDDLRTRELAPRARRPAQELFFDGAWGAADQ